MRSPRGLPRAFLRFLTLEDALVLSKVSAGWRQFVLGNVASEILTRAQVYEIGPKERRLIWWTLLTRRRLAPSIFQSDELFLQGYNQGCAYTPDLGQIRKDICRTNFGAKPEVLEAVLVTTLFKAPLPVPYCQGMNYIAGLFLTVFPRPRRAANTLYHWLFSAGEITRFDRNFKSVLDDCAQIDTYCRRNCPQLKKLIDEYGLELHLFTFNWLLLHFVYELHKKHLPILLNLWDHFILHGDSFLFKAVILLLNQAERKNQIRALTHVCAGAVTAENWAILDEEEFIVRLKGQPYSDLRLFPYVELPQTYFSRYSRSTSLIKAILGVPEVPEVPLAPGRTGLAQQSSPINRRSYCFTPPSFSSTSNFSTPTSVAEESLGRGMSPASRLRRLRKP